MVFFKIDRKNLLLLNCTVNNFQTGNRQFIMDCFGSQLLFETCFIISIKIFDTLIKFDWLVQTSSVQSFEPTILVTGVL